MGANGKGKSQTKKERRTYEVGVPHADNVLDAYFTHEEAVHPAKAELDELDALVLEVLGEGGVDAGGEIAQRADLALDAGLCDNVVVLDAVEELGEAPEGVGFDGVEHRLGQLTRVHAGLDVRVGNVQAEEDLEEGCDEVVYALDVAACWVAHGPEVQDALEGALRGLVAVELDVRVCPRNVDANLVPDGFVQASCSAGRGCVGADPFKGLPHAVDVFFALALKSCHSSFAVGRQVAEEELPRHGAHFLGDA